MSKIQEWEERVHETSATVDDVAALEKILKHSILVRGIAGEAICNSGKHQFGGNGVRGEVELIWYNGHAWSKALHFPQSREVHIYSGNVWEAIREATQGKPLVAWVVVGQDNSLSVDQFMSQDRRMYRTHEAHQRLQRICDALGNVSMGKMVFSENHTAAIVAKEKKGFQPTLASLEDDIKKACVENGHGGLWNPMDYDMREVISIDMKACYPASFLGEGEAKPYFECFGHPTHRMTRVSMYQCPRHWPRLCPGPWVGIQQQRPSCHPTWFGRHFTDATNGGWAPTPLLTYMAESGLLKCLKVLEAIIAFKKETKVWLPKAASRGTPS